MDQKNYPEHGCGTAGDITGCRFTLSSMSDNFVAVILGAIKKVNAKKIWNATGVMSTVYRGKRIHVMDCLKACFVHANDGKTHVVMEAAVSKGSPDDGDDRYLAEDNALLNNTQVKFNVFSAVSFYPMGIADYMDRITHVVKIAMDRGLYVESSHCASILKGDINDLFDYFDVVLEYAEQNISRYVLQVTLSVNSPSVADNEHAH